MTLLEDVKRGIGVFYSDVNKDLDVQRMINSATNYFKGAGWDFTTLLSSIKEQELIIESLQIEKSEALIELQEEGLTEGEILIINETIETLEGEIAIAQTELDAIDISLATDAIILYCKMAQSTDPAQLTNHPILTSFIAQSRAVVSDVEV